MPAGSLLDVLTEDIFAACEPVQAASAYALQGCLCAVAAAASSDGLCERQNTPLQNISSAAGQAAQAQPISSRTAATSPQANGLAASNGRPSSIGHPAVAANGSAMPGVPQALTGRIAKVAAVWMKRVLISSGKSTADFWKALEAHDAFGQRADWLRCLEPLHVLLPCCPAVRSYLLQAVQAGTR